MKNLNFKIGVFLIFLCSVCWAQTETQYLGYTTKQVIDTFEDPHYIEADPLNSKISIFGYALDGCTPGYKGYIEFDILRGKVKNVRLVWFVNTRNQADKQVVLLATALQASGLRYTGVADKEIHTQMYLSDEYKASVNYYTPRQTQTKFYMITSVLTNK